MEMLGAGLLVVLLVGMVVGLRVRRRQRQADLRPTDAVRSDESMFVAAPSSSVDRVESPRDLGIPARRPLLSDRLIAGAIAGVLLGGIVCTLEVTGFAGSAGAILARPMAAFPLFEDRVGSLFAGVLTVALGAFVVGFAYPRLVNRV